MLLLNKDSHTDSQYSFRLDNNSFDPLLGYQRSTRFGLRSEHDRANAGAPGVGVTEAAIITTLNSSTSNFKTKLIIQYNTAGP